MNSNLSGTQPKEQNTAMQNNRLVNMLSAFAIYTPAFAMFNAVGFVAIYIMGRIGVLAGAPTQFIWIAFSSFALSLIFFFAGRILKQGRLTAAQYLMAAGTGLFFIMFNMIWSGLTLFLHVGVWMAPIVQLVLARKWSERIPGIVVGAAGTILLVLSNSFTIANPLTFSDPGAAFGLGFLVFAILVLIILVLVLRVIQFRTISSRLLVSFMVIVALPTVIVTMLTGYTTYQHDIDNTFAQLGIVADLKKTQIDQFVAPLKTDLSDALQNANDVQRLRYILTNPPEAAQYRANYNQMTNRVKSLLAGKSTLQEFFIMDQLGNVIISSNDASVGRSYANQDFFQEPLMGDEYVYLVENKFADFGLFGTTSVLAVQAIRTPDGAIVGVAALRSSFESISQVMGINPGIGETSDSYLINSKLQRITPTLSSYEVRTTGAISAIRAQKSGFAIYPNYDGIPVLGVYRWIPELKAGLITEISQAEAFQNTFSILITDIFIGLFSLAIASMAVVITARSISRPIVSLSDTVRMLAAGNLAVRSDVVREDEIGDLSGSFNVMANELSTTVSTLEERVQARTRDIEKQAARLRVASEVARDAASARNLEELLNRSANLILQRFGFYHTGIFLLDENREYAILRASPTEAGKKMIENQHKLKVGETGIVGYVSATGEPRIALDTGTDEAHFRNPLLPQTRSEMALPLKANNRVIGVLDVQSEQANAFTQEDIATLQIMADQLATAIERTRLLQEVEQSLGEIERAYREFTRDSWRSFAESKQAVSGYRYTGIKLEPYTRVDEESRMTLQRGTPIIVAGSQGGQATLAVPIQLRGQTIGVLNFKLLTEQVPQETIAMAQEAAGRLAFSLENSRLITETRLRAENDRAITEVSTRIGSSVNMEEVLRSTVEEIGKILGDSEVVLQVSPRYTNRPQA